MFLKKVMFLKVKIDVSEKMMFLFYCENIFFLKRASLFEKNNAVRILSDFYIQKKQVIFPEKSNVV